MASEVGPKPNVNYTGGPGMPAHWPAIMCLRRESRVGKNYVQCWYFVLVWTLRENSRISGISKTVTVCWSRIAPVWMENSCWCKNHSSHLTRSKSLLVSHSEWLWPGNTDLGHLRLHGATWKQCHEVLCFYRTNKVIDQGKFKIHLWVHQIGSYSKIEEAVLQAWDALCWQS